MLSNVFYAIAPPALSDPLGSAMSAGRQQLCYRAATPRAGVGMGFSAIGAQLLRGFQIVWNGGVPTLAAFLVSLILVIAISAALYLASLLAWRTYRGRTRPASFLLSARETETYSIEVYRQEGDPFRSVRLSVNADGSVRFDAQDMGKQVEEVWGDSDYEFWVDVPATALRKLVFALLREKYAGRARAVDEFTAFCKREEIEHKWDSWV